MPARECARAFRQHGQDIANPGVELTQLLGGLLTTSCERLVPGRLGHGADALRGRSHPADIEPHVRVKRPGLVAVLIVLVAGQGGCRPEAPPRGRSRRPPVLRRWRKTGLPQVRDRSPPRGPPSPCPIRRWTRAVVVGVGPIAIRVVVEPPPHSTTRFVMSPRIVVVATAATSPSSPPSATPQEPATSTAAAAAPTTTMDLVVRLVAPGGCLFPRAPLLTMIPLLPRRGRAIRPLRGFGASRRSSRGPASVG